MRTTLLSMVAMILAAQTGSAEPAGPAFDSATRAVSGWRAQALGNLVLDADQAKALAGATPAVARCVKLNNYWCIKTAGWKGEIAADAEGHVAFGSAEAGAAVAALLLKRYYVDFGRKTAVAIISHWAPAQCGVAAAAGLQRRPSGSPPAGLRDTLRARWLATHARGFAMRTRQGRVRRSVVADFVARPMPVPTIAVGLGEATRPITLDALLRASPNAPPSRSMLGLPHAGRAVAMGSLGGCASDGARIASYAAKAAADIATAPDGDLGLFSADGAPTPNLATMMANMARVEIGPLAATPALVRAGIAAAFAPGRNPVRP